MPLTFDATHTTSVTAEDPRLPGHTVRDHEQRGVILSLVALFISIALIAGAIGFTSWAWVTAPLDFEDGTDGENRTSVFVLSIIYAALYVIVLILSIIAGAIGVIWFFLWISGTKPRAQRGLMSVFVVLLILIAIGYFINFLVALGYFVLKIIYEDDDQNHIGFFGALAGFVYSVLFVLLALAVQSVCTERYDTSAY